MYSIPPKGWAKHLSHLSCQTSGQPPTLTPYKKQAHPASGSEAVNKPQAAVLGGWTAGVGLEWADQGGLREKAGGVWRGGRVEGKAEIMMVSIQGGCQALGRMAVGGHLDVLSLVQPFLWRMDGLI